MPYHFLLEARRNNGEKVYLGSGILGQIFSVEAKGERQTLLALKDPKMIPLETYTIDAPLAKVIEKLEFAID